MILAINGKRVGMLPLQFRVACCHREIMVLLEGQSEFMAALFRPVAKVFESVFDRVLNGPSAAFALVANFIPGCLQHAAPAKLGAAFVGIFFHDRSVKVLLPQSCQ